MPPGLQLTCKVLGPRRRTHGRKGKIPHPIPLRFLGFLAGGVGPRPDQKQESGEASNARRSPLARQIFSAKIHTVILFPFIFTSMSFHVYVLN